MEQVCTHRGIASSIDTGDFEIAFSFFSTDGGAVQRKHNRIRLNQCVPRIVQDRLPLAVGISTRHAVMTIHSSAVGIDIVGLVHLESC